MKFPFSTLMLILKVIAKCLRIFWYLQLWTDIFQLVLCLQLRDETVLSLSFVLIWTGYRACNMLITMYGMGVVYPGDPSGSTIFFCSYFLSSKIRSNVYPQTVILFSTNDIKLCFFSKEKKRFWFQVQTNPQPIPIPIF